MQHDTKSVAIYIAIRPGETIMTAAFRACALGYPYLLFNGYIVPSTEIPADYHKICPFVGFHYLTDLDRHLEGAKGPNQGGDVGNTKSI
jgi:hypothetical protein